MIVCTHPASSTPGAGTANAYRARTDERDGERHLVGDTTEFPSRSKRNNLPMPRPAGLSGVMAPVRERWSPTSLRAPAARSQQAPRLDLVLEFLPVIN